jgi:hypothetical protein
VGTSRRTKSLTTRAQIFKEALGENLKHERTIKEEG